MSGLFDYDLVAGWDNEERDLYEGWYKDSFDDEYDYDDCFSDEEESYLKAVEDDWLAYEDEQVVPPEIDCD